VLCSLFKSLGELVFVLYIQTEQATPFYDRLFEAGTWEVEIANTRYPAVASLKPLFDPENKKVKL
jgi:4-methylaminobutanoate oxidase (formaldehyde-forming)